MKTRVPFRAKDWVIHAGAIRTAHVSASNPELECPRYRLSDVARDRQAVSCWQLDIRSREAVWALQGLLQ